MKTGIRYQTGMDIEGLREAGFDGIEYRYTGKLWEGSGTEDSRCRMAGMVMKPELLWNGGFLRALHTAAALEASYLVIETVGMEDTAGLFELFEQHLKELEHFGIQIYIENGCRRRSAGQAARSDFSEAEVLRNFADRMNRQMGSPCFGICLNIGKANLLGQNICGMIEDLGQRIALLHVNDNDGMHDLCQLPYTFTKGRGQLITDWYGIIGTLAGMHFRGSVVFNLTGLFDVSPVPLHAAWYKLLLSMAGEWESILGLEEYLERTDCRILFGAGRMFRNYMEVWGSTYPPLFTVDNNKDLWGKRQMGIEIRPPEALLEYTKEERAVLLCNMYYEPIEEQLQAMGVRSRRYNDQYFFRQQGAGI